MNKRQLLRATALVASSLLLAGTASAQDFPPKKPVTLVVGFAAGGAADAAARLIAKKLGENIGQTVVVDNKGGAGGNIAHQFVANAAPDGTVLLFGSVGPLTIAPHLMKLTYDPFKDLAAISGGVNFPNVLVVHKAAGAKTLAEFIQLSKKKPGSVDFASTGAGSASHLAGELFNQRAGIDMTHGPAHLPERSDAGSAGPTIACERYRDRSGEHGGLRGGVDRQAGPQPVMVADGPQHRLRLREDGTWRVRRAPRRPDPLPGRPGASA